MTRGDTYKIVEDTPYTLNAGATYIKFDADYRENGSDRYYESDGQFTFGSDDRHLYINFWPTDDSVFSLDYSFSVPNESATGLVPGTTYPNARWGSGLDGFPSMELTSADGGFGGAVQGSFTILQLERNTDGSMKRFAVNYTDTVNGLSGSIRYHAIPANSNWGVLYNDQTTPAATMSAQLVSTAQHGALTFRRDGTFDYTPERDFAGNDSFTYRAVNSSGTSSVETVTLVVDQKNDKPSFAAGSTVNVTEDAGSIAISNWATQISMGPANESNQTPKFYVLNPPPYLFAQAPRIDAAGTLRFKTNPNVFGTVQLSLRLRDSGGSSYGGNNEARGTLNIVVTSVNDAPIIRNDAFVAYRNKRLRVSSPGANTYAAYRVARENAGGPSNGSSTTFEISETDGRITVADFTDDDSSRFSFSGPNGQPLRPGVYSIAYDSLGLPLPNQPELRADNHYGSLYDTRVTYASFAIHQLIRGSDGRILRFAADFKEMRAHTENYPNLGTKSTLTGEIRYNYIAPFGLLANDSEQDFDVMSAKLVTPPRHGNVSVNNDGSFSYEPDTDYIGADSFTYTASDGAITTSPAAVKITVKNGRSVSGKVIDDKNGNFRIDVGESGLKGAIAYIDRNGDSKIDSNEPSVRIGTTGAFFFDGLSNGKAYIIRIVLPDDYGFITSSAEYVMVYEGSPDQTLNFLGKKS